MEQVRRHARRLGPLAAAVVAVALWAAPAAAHVEVSADHPRAGAADVTVSFVAESESRTAGIVSMEVVLPKGIAPEDVTWVSGPDGWVLTPGEVAGEPGYTMSGPEVPAGTDAAYQVRIVRLPADATELAFRTLQTYSDGRVDRWIELPQPGAEPRAPAPVLTLTPAGSGAAPADDGGGSSVWVWIITAVLILLAAAGGLLWWRRRAAADRPPARPEPIKR